MKRKSTISKIITIVPPWGLIGAALILLPMLAFVTYEDINRQNAASRRQLLTKGAALIRSFEAGTRAGMMMQQWENRHLQRLLVETAHQPDITYLMVSDINGKILAHSNPDLIDQQHGHDLDLQQVFAAPTEIYRIIVAADANAKIFEVFRKFKPARGPMGRMGRHHMMMQPSQQKNLDNLLIFVGLDMTEVEKALAADTRHSLFMAAILLLVGFAVVTLLFMTHT
jgi:two-component system sensor histidine kinase HydH